MRAALKYIALSFIPLSLLIALMCYYASDIPYNDEWVIAHLLEKFHEGTLTFADLFAQHNEHKIAVVLREDYSVACICGCMYRLLFLGL